MIRPARRDQDGSVVLWVLLLVVFVIVPMGGIAIDLWRGLSAHVALAAAADAAATAGANQIDATVYRQSNTVQLEPHLAEQAAANNLAAQTDLPAVDTYDIHADTSEVVVTLRAELPAGFLSLLSGERLEMTARAAGKPHLR